MSCCGQRRAALRASPRAPMRIDLPPAIDADAVPLHYLDSRSLAILGPVTARAYRFEPGIATPVDARDAPRMLATGRFARTAIEAP